MTNQNQPPLLIEAIAGALTAIGKLGIETALGLLDHALAPNVPEEEPQERPQPRAIPWRNRPPVGAIQVWCHKEPYAGHWYLVTGLVRDEYTDMPPCPLSEDEHDRPRETVRNDHRAVRGGARAIDDAIADWEADAAAAARMAAAHRLDDENRRLRGEPPAPVGFEAGRPLWLTNCVICTAGLMVTDHKREWTCQTCASVLGWDGVTSTVTVELKVIGAHR